MPQLCQTRRGVVLLQFVCDWTPQDALSVQCADKLAGWVANRAWPLDMAATRADGVCTLLWFLVPGLQSVPAGVGPWRLQGRQPSYCLPLVFLARSRKGRAVVVLLRLAWGFSQLRMARLPCHAGSAAV